MQVVTLELKRVSSSNDPHQALRAQEEYELRNPDGSGMYTRLTLDWARLYTLLTELQRSEGAPEAALAVGQALQDFLWPAGWMSVEQELIEQSRRDQVLVSIRSEAAELYALPWELLQLRSTSMALGALPNCSLRYSWSGLPPSAPRPDGEGRLLFAWSAASGQVPAAAHLEALEATSGPFRFDRDQDVVPGFNLRSLVDRLRAEEGRVRALHVLCHGSPDGLVLQGPAGTEVVGASRLQQALAPFAGQLSMVVLCVCQSGDGAPTGRREGSVAQALHKLNIPYVLASRFPLSVPGSVTLTRALYGQLATAPDDFDRAVSAARHDLTVESGHIDHLSVQLYAVPAEPRQGEGRDETPGPPASDRRRAEDLRVAREQPWLPFPFVGTTGELPPSSPTFATLLAVQAVPTALLWGAYVYTGAFFGLTAETSPHHAASRGFYDGLNWGLSYLWPPLLALAATASWNPMRHAWIDLVERGVIRRTDLPERGVLAELVAEDVQWMQDTLQWYRRWLIRIGVLAGSLIGIALVIDAYQLASGVVRIEPSTVEEGLQCCRIYSAGRPYSMACHFSMAHLEPCREDIPLYAAAFANAFELIAESTWVCAAVIALVQMAFHVIFFARFENMPRVRERKMRLGLVLDGSAELGLTAWNEEYTRFCGIFILGLTPALASLYNSRVYMKNPAFSDTDFYTVSVPFLGLAIVLGFTWVVRTVRKDQIRRDSDRWNLPTREVEAIRAGRVWPMNYSSPQLALVLLAILGLQFATMIGLYVIPSGASEALREECPTLPLPSDFDDQQRSTCPEDATP